MLNHPLKMLVVTGIIALGTVLQFDVRAQAYPNKPVKIVVGFSPGGGPDITARVLGQKFSEKWNQSVVIENKVGAGANIASQFVANSKPDGYTLLSVSNAFSISPAIYPKLPFDAMKDFDGITLTATGPALLIISPKLKVTSVAELVAMAKKNPGQMTYSSAGIGSGSHFAAEILRSKAGLELLHIPTKGIPEGLTEVMSGRVDFFISPYASAIAMVKDGRAKAIAITSLKRSKEMADMPTVAETVPGYQWQFWYGLLAPAGTPKDILQQIALEVKRINELPELKERYASIGIEPASDTPAQFDIFVQNEIKDFSAIAKAAKIIAE
ncbi:tripartite tricarboxylate transporter substrate binding protein [Polynucleobacter rarus]|jgi:tripartite-type tricarboxylate transporter receptor subunit TctC|uniref:tripartite tricarboxylate transporter substrate binding protein n=1 Tax=Polynucleobacter rarus TaxID=556055 RepID=UPI000D3E7F43|nr:tripartite tricarboxylate transporter substrate binding protein [Polynucleobacter rarus]